MHSSTSLMDLILLYSQTMWKGMPPYLACLQYFIYQQYKGIFQMKSFLLSFFCIGNCHIWILCYDYVFSSDEMRD